MKPLRILFACVVLVVPAITVAQEPSEKLPVPDDDAQKQAVALIANLYKSDYESAKTPEQRVALAKKMLQVGVESRNDLTGRYVLLRIARDIAAGAADVETAMKAIEFLNERYDVDVLRMQANVLEQAVKAARLPKDHQGFANVLRDTTYAAIAKDRFDLAKAINDTAVSSARQARNIDLIKEVVQRRNEIEEVERSYQDVKEAVAVLDRSPTDPEANLLVGQYRCFVRGDWDTGLPMLALGSDDKLKALATSELAETPDPLDLGNAWWEYAESVDGQAIQAARQRAAEWYKQTLPILTGLSKKVVETRLDEFHAVAASSERTSKTTQLREKFAPDAIEIDGHYYKVFFGRISWPDAVKACKGMGGYLVCLETMEEQKKVAAIKNADIQKKGTTGNVVWVGGYLSKNREWKWLNGSSMKGEQFSSDPGTLPFVAYNAEDRFNTRLIDGSRPGAPRENQGFICEWDE